MKNKKLYIIRHAKAETPSIEKADFERNIIQSGIDRAERIAESLCHKVDENVKTLFISSPAFRASQTAVLFADRLSYPKTEILYDKNIYEASARTLLQIINAVDERYQAVFLFGHNPGLTDLVNYITGEYIELKTANVAVIELEENSSFSYITENNTYLKDFLD